MQTLRKVKMFACNREYTLSTWDTGRRHPNGPQWLLGYVFRDADGIIFSGEDYGCSPCHAVDSDESLRGLLSFLTLRPGDTDEEYFERYTRRQMDFAERDAEELSLYCDSEDPYSFEEA